MGKRHEVDLDEMDNGLGEEEFADETDKEEVVDEAEENIEEEPKEEFEEEVAEDTKEEKIEDKGGESDYQPSLKFKIQDTEFDIPDYLHSAIKDKDTEEKIKDILTKANGLEEVKVSRDTFKAKYSELEKDYRNLDEKFMPAVQLYKNGLKKEAVLSLFSQEDILEVASGLRQYHEATPEEKRRIEQESMMLMKAYQETNRASESENMLLEVKRKQTELEINTMLTYDNSVKDVADWYDSIYGKGEFKKEVYKEGNLSYYRGELLEPQQTVQIVRDRLSKIRPASQQVSSNTVKANTVIVKKSGSPSGQDRIPTTKSVGSVAGKKPLSKLPENEQTFAKAREYIEQEENE